MKYIKRYNEGYMEEKINDIREFFSNLKMITYHFEDYDIFNKFKNDIEKVLNTTCGMSFFGFTNLSECLYIPIIDTVTVQLHRMFDIILNNDYQGIYEGCNERKFYYNTFFEYDNKGKYYVKLKNHISEVISKQVNDEDFKSYYHILFRTRSFNNSEKIEEEKETNIINSIIDKYNLNDKYTISIYSSGSRRELNIIRKNRIVLNSGQEKEIEEAKIFGLQKYEELKKLQSTQDDYNNTVDKTKKFNI